MKRARFGNFSFRSLLTSGGEEISEQELLERFLSDVRRVLSDIDLETFKRDVLRQGGYLWDDGEEREVAPPPVGFEARYLESEGIKMGGLDENSDDGVWIAVPTGTTTPSIHLTHGSSKQWGDLRNFPESTLFWNEDEEKWVEFQEGLIYLLD